MALNIDDYLIDYSELNWSQLLPPWGRLLPAEITPWLMNRFGDLFVILDDESIHMLDLGRGTFERVADSRDHFCDLMDEQENANQWLMIPLVDKLVAAGKVIEPGFCYGYEQSPVLGGAYSVENTIVLPVAEQYDVNATIHEQIKDLADGAKVMLKVTDEEPSRGAKD